MYVCMDDAYKQHNPKPPPPPRQKKRRRRKKNDGLCLWDGNMKVFSYFFVKFICEWDQRDSNENAAEHWIRIIEKINEDKMRKLDLNENSNEWNENKWKRVSYIKQKKIKKKKKKMEKLKQWNDEVATAQQQLKFLLFFKRIRFLLRKQFKQIYDRKAILNGGNT